MFRGNKDLTSLNNRLNTLVHMIVNVLTDNSWLRRVRVFCFIDNTLVFELTLFLFEMLSEIFGVALVDIVLDCGS